MPKFKQYAENVYKGAYSFYCPGCKETHVVFTQPIDNWPVWGFNADLDRPTVTPSIKVIKPMADKENVCHSFITDGRIEFLSDCTHELRGQTIELPEIY